VILVKNAHIMSTVFLVMFPLHKEINVLFFPYERERTI